MCRASPLPPLASPCLPLPPCLPLALCLPLPLALCLPPCLFLTPGASRVCEAEHGGLRVRPLPRHLRRQEDGREVPARLHRGRAHPRRGGGHALHRLRCASPCARGCSQMHQRLQHMHQRLRPLVSEAASPEAAAPCVRGCNPLCPEAASPAPQARCSACWRVPPQWRQRRRRSAAHSTRRCSTQPSTAVRAKRRASSRRTNPTPNLNPAPNPSPKPNP